ncbi:MAG: hypothetical protein NVSMB29_10240 [Candidatus Dormibacteria bacterium]
MGYISGLVKGTLVGAVVGVCIAPQTGEETRNQLKRLLAGARLGADDARQHVGPSAEPSVHKAWDGAASVLAKADDAVNR